MCLILYYINIWNFSQTLLIHILMHFLTACNVLFFIDPPSFHPVNHGLHGSASPVLTATGLVNGRGQFSTRPQNPHTLTDHQKIWYMWLRRRPLRLCQIWCKSFDGGLLGNEIFIYLYLFHELTYRSDQSMDFHALWLKRRILAQGCAFWEFRWHCSLFWGWNAPKTPILGASIGIFKPKWKNIESFMLSKLLHRFRPNFAQRWRPSSGRRGWSL